MLRGVFLLNLVFSIAICEAQLLENLLRSDTNLIVKKVMSDPEKYRLQIIYTQLVDSVQLPIKNPLSNATHYFGRKSDEYYFPASLVKLPVSAFAMEKIASLSLFGITPFSPFKPLSDFQCQGLKYDPRLVMPQSLYDLMNKIFVYSDNEAYNYLYELCGQAYIKQRLFEMGYTKARILEKIANCSGENNRTTGPIAFFQNQELFHVEGRQTGIKDTLPVSREALVGKGYMWNGRYVPAPKDFSSANFLPLIDVHQILLAIVAPDCLAEKQRFLIQESERLLIKNAMSILPSQLFPDSCFKRPYPDNHMKFLFGQQANIPQHLKIYNKVGLAHGFISDCSYIEDTENKVRFFLSAVLYVNEDGVLNDGKYEYQTIGVPFLRRLGEMVYQYELKKTLR